MSMKTLLQHKNVETREVRFSDSKLFCKVSKFGNTNEIDIPFENIDGEKVSFKSSNNTVLMISVGLLLVSCIALLFELHTLFPIIGFFITVV
jgi:hypothetical protein